MDCVEGNDMSAKFLKEKKRESLRKQEADKAEV